MSQRPIPSPFIINACFNAHIRVEPCICGTNPVKFSTGDCIQTEYNGEAADALLHQRRVLKLPPTPTARGQCGGISVLGPANGGMVWEAATGRADWNVDTLSSQSGLVHRRYCNGGCLLLHQCEYGDAQVSTAGTFGSTCGSALCG